eukprot:TRINITY_DN4668_c0_g1_i2.p1 TRINITY_DN4668_c0_g1~~TRINITY_DN4668_c0_g1_i2.p1  ORF type:complete len:415 (-),score=60.98 TRINITY_DN4668_c0_g1_i2:24-1268(-)
MCIRDRNSKIKPVESRQTTKKLLNSVKLIIRKERFNAGKTYIAGKGNLNRGGKEVQNKSQLTTYSSQKQIADAKKDRKELEHEEMLHEELRKFRIEIETKFRASEVNKIYKFPNSRNEAVTSRHHDCTLLHKPLDSTIKAEIYATQPLAEDSEGILINLKKEDDSSKNATSTIRFLGKMKGILHKVNKSEKDLSFLFKTEEECETEGTRCNEVKTERANEKKKSFLKQANCCTDKNAKHTRSTQEKFDELTFASMLSEIHKILNRNTSYKDIKRGSSKQKVSHMSKASMELLRCENILWNDAKKRMNQEYFNIKGKSGNLGLKAALDKANHKVPKSSQNSKKKPATASASQLQIRPTSSTKYPLIRNRIGRIHIKRCRRIVWGGTIRHTCIWCKRGRIATRGCYEIDTFKCYVT